MPSSWAIWSEEIPFRATETLYIAYSHIFTGSGLACMIVPILHVNCFRQVRQW